MNVNIFIISILTLFITGCMPDSLTKFEEDPPKKKENGASANGGGAGGAGGAAGSPHTSVFVAGFNVGDQPKIFLQNGIAMSHQISFSGGAAVLSEMSFALNLFNGQALPEGISLNTTTGVISGTPNELPDLFTTLSEHVIDVTHEPTGTVISQAIYLHVSSGVADGVTDEIGFRDIFVDQAASQDLIMTLNDVSAFQLGDFISNENLTVGKVKYIDPTNSEIHVTIQAGSASVFRVTDPVDDAASFSTAATTVTSVTYAFPTGSAISMNLSFELLPIGTFINADEKRDWLTYSISPSLPTNLQFDGGGSESTSGDPTNLFDFDAGGGATTFPDTGNSSGQGTSTMSGTVLSADSQSTILHTLTMRMVPTFDASLQITGDNTAATVSSSFGLSVLDFAMPKRAESIDYPVIPGSKQVLTLASVASFSAIAGDANNFVSNALGYKATIDSIDTVGNRLFVTVCGGSNSCTFRDITGSSYTNQTGFIRKFSINEIQGSVDNAANFFSSSTTVTEVETSLAFDTELSTGSAIDFFPLINLISSAEDDISGVVSVSASSANVTGIGTKFNSELVENGLFVINGQYRTIASITNDTALVLSAAMPAGTTYSSVEYQASLIDYSASSFSSGGASTFAGADEIKTYTYSVSPDIASLPASTGLTFDTDTGIITKTGSSTTPIDLTSFIVSATDLRGNTVETSERFVTDVPPVGLSSSRAMVLNVPSTTAFVIGDYISNQENSDGAQITGALGVVTDKFAGPGGTFDNYLVVNMLKGEFEEFDDLDNVGRFDAQKTYVLGEGAEHYSISVQVDNVTGYTKTSDATNTNDIFLSVNSLAQCESQDIFSSSTERGFVGHVRDFDNGGAGTQGIIYVRMEKGTFSTAEFLCGNTVPGGTAPQSGGGTTAALIEQIDARNIILTKAVAAVVAVPEVGISITVDGSTVQDNDSLDTTDATITNRVDGIGVVTEINNSGNDIHVESKEGRFIVGGNINFTSTFEDIEGGTDVLITKVTSENRYILKTGSPARIQINIEQLGNGTIGFSTGAPLPAGLDATFDSTNGLFIIEGIPTDLSDEEVYTVKATNEFGSIEHTFSIEVEDSFEIKLESTFATQVRSFELHRIGKGLGRTSCSISRKQLNTTRLNCTATCSGLGNENCVSRPRCESVTDGAGQWLENPKDIVCALDVGELELYREGFDLKLNSAPGLCEQSRIVPFSLWEYPAGATTTTGSVIIKNAGDVTESICVSAHNDELGSCFVNPGFAAAAQTTETTCTGAGNVWVSEVFDSAVAIPNTEPEVQNSAALPTVTLVAKAPLSVLFSDVTTTVTFNDTQEKYCGFNYSQDDRTEDFNRRPDCDTGSVKVIEREFSAIAAICIDPVTGTDVASNAGTQSACEDSIGECRANNAGGTLLGAVCGGANDVECDNRTDCELEATGFWVGGTFTAGNCTIVDTPSVPNFSCDGVEGACKGGAIRDIFSNDDDVDNFSSILVSSQTGINRDVFFLGPNEDRPIKGTNLKLSNYFRTNSCTENTNFPYEYNTGDWVRAINADTGNVTRALMAGTSPFYEFHCLNGSGGIKARIRLIVRDWNEVFRVSDGIDGAFPGTPGSNTVVDNILDIGAAGETDPFGSPFNNILDWEDDYSGNGAGNYTSATCGDRTGGGSVDYSVPGNAF
jgi:hypothetical protein